MIREVDSDKALQIFLELPLAIFRSDPTHRPGSDTADEAAFLRGEHILSMEIEIRAFLLLEGDDLELDCCLARIALIVPRQGDEAYFGFFAARPELSSINDLMSLVESEAKIYQRKRLMGPVNGSFWLGYRFKIDHFEDEPYFGEPRNPAHYPDLFTASSYDVVRRYHSNLYPKGAAITPRMKTRLQSFLNQGYEIRPPKRRETTRLLHDIYRLITRLYADFPTYQAISEEQFLKLFRKLPLILDFKLLRIARFQGVCVGFLISFPDYGTRLDGYASTMGKIKALLSKRSVERSVLLYLGAEPEHLGLGSALVASLAETITPRELSLVAALISSGKISASYAYQEISETREYVLLGKEIK